MAKTIKIYLFGRITWIAIAKKFERFGKWIHKRNESLKVYDEFDAKLNDLLAERDRQLSECEDRKEWNEIKENFDYEINVQNVIGINKDM